VNATGGGGESIGLLNWISGLFGTDTAKIAGIPFDNRFRMDQFLCKDKRVSELS
jgi:hypothetical protein